MRRFRFPLERVLGLYSAQERQEKRTLAAATARLRELEGVSTQVDASAAALDESFAADVLYGAVLSARRAALAGLVRTATSTLDVAKENWLAARARQRSVAAARERAVDRHRYETARAEARELDEWGIGRVRRAPGPEEPS